MPDADTQRPRRRRGSRGRGHTQKRALAKVLADHPSERPSTTTNEGAAAMSQNTTTPDTTTTTAADPRRPFPRPVAPEPSDQPGPGLVSLYGYCRPWCGEFGPDGEGHTVEHHGDRCAIMAGLLDGFDDKGRTVGVAADMVAPYSHGLYRSEDIYPAPRHSEYVTLHFEDADGAQGRTHFTIGDARRLAAILLRVADAADHLDRPLGSATFSRGEGSR